VLSSPNPADNTSEFGRGAAVSGDNAIVGSMRDDDRGDSAGAAFVYERDSALGVWAHVGKVFGSDTSAGDWFGYSVAVHGDTAIIGAPKEASAGWDSGAAYIFRRSPTGVWSQSQKIVAPDAAGLGELFGYSVDLDDGLAIVGARYDNEVASRSGAAYVFSESGGVWSFDAKLTGSDATADDSFGYKVAITPDVAVVGALWHENGNYAKAGAAYVFGLDQGAWIEEFKLAGTQANGILGSDVGVASGVIVVGAAGESAPGGNLNGGAHVLTRSLGSWSEVAVLAPSQQLQYGSFGYSVDVEGGKVVVASPQSDLQAVYVFEEVNGTWQEVQVLGPSNPNSGQLVGFTVDLDAGTLLAGSIGYFGGANDGAALVFEVTPPDTVAPTVSPVLPPVDGDDGWFVSSPVTVGWDAVDPEPSAGGVVDPPDTIADMEGTHTYTSDEVCDAVGNCATGSVDVSIDVSNPTVSGSVSSAANGAGWYTSAVTVSFACGDAVSGVASCTAPVMLGSEGAGQSVVGTAVDVAGRSATTTVSGINIDLTAPAVDSVSLSVNPKALSESSTLTAEVSDATSGVDAVEFSVNGGAFEAMSLAGSTATAVFDDSLAAGVYQIDVRAQDVTGNVSEPSTVYLVVFDPSGAWATGGGWFIPGGPTSDPGDLLPGLDGTSKAHFGFSVKYQNGQSTVPSGNLQFRYIVPGQGPTLVVEDAGFDWLVVTNNTWAKFQGLVTVDGAAGLHPVHVDARDSNNQPDRFVIKIWSPGADPDVDDPVYKASGDLGAGNIKIHNN
jgi:hypothetical protein